VRMLTVKRVILEDDDRVRLRTRDFVYIYVKHCGDGVPDLARFLLQENLHKDG